MSIYLHKCWSTMTEGNIDHRNIIDINEVVVLKLVCSFKTSNEHSTYLLRFKTMRRNGCIIYHIDSSILLNIKTKLYFINDHSRWKLGDDKILNFMNWHLVKRTFDHML